MTEAERLKAKITILTKQIEQAEAENNLQRSYDLYCRAIPMISVVLTFP